MAIREKLWTVVFEIPNQTEVVSLRFADKRDAELAFDHAADRIRLGRPYVEARAEGTGSRFVIPLIPVPIVRLYGP
jgi:hypothetical protein